VDTGTRTWLGYPIGEWAIGLVVGAALMAALLRTDGWALWGLMAMALAAWTVRAVYGLIAALTAQAERRADR
jgi:hypothetical protein